MFQMNAKGNKRQLDRSGLKPRIECPLLETNHGIVLQQVGLAPSKENYYVHL
jgi:hypothetical protein